MYLTTKILKFSPSTVTVSYYKTLLYTLINNYIFIKQTYNILCVLDKVNIPFPDVSKDT